MPDIEEHKQYILNIWAARAFELLGRLDDEEARSLYDSAPGVLREIYDIHVEGIKRIDRLFEKYAKMQLPT